MKGGVVAIIAAARAVSGIQLSRPFAVHTVIGEEDGGLGTFATLRRGHIGDACVIAEPTDGQIVAANAGSLTFRIEVVGTRDPRLDARHRATARSTPSSVLHRALARARDRTQCALRRTRSASCPGPSASASSTPATGPAPCPDLLVAEGRYGVMPGESFADAKAAFEDALATAAAADPWLADNPPTVTWPGGHFAAGRLPEGDPFGDQVVEAVIAAGEPAAPDRRAVRLGPAAVRSAGIPTVQYGPGNIADAHAVDEHVAIDEVVTCARAYAELILARCR